MGKDVIIACDFASERETLEFLDLFGEKKPFVKIGMELFYSCGAGIVREIKRRGHRIFLDLKLHDIPNTVGKTMRVLSALNVDMSNLHASGGSEMMKAAVSGLTRPDGSRPLLVAVTQLTSTSDTMLRDELLIGSTMEETVTSYAQNAKNCGLDGVVCSPLEAEKVHTRNGTGFLTVTPGIRFESTNDDQKRVTTPEKAKKLGCDYIVVGRPITASADPEEAYKSCLRDFI